MLFALLPIVEGLEQAAPEVEPVVGSLFDCNVDLHWVLRCLSCYIGFYSVLRCLELSNA